MILGLVNAGVGFTFAGRPRLNIPYGAVAAVLALLFFSSLGCLACFKQRRKYRPEADGPIPPHAYPAATPGVSPYQDVELHRQPTYGSQPPEAYEPATPYSPTFPSPYTPISAYTPVTPQTWKKEEIERWSQAPKGWDEGFR